MGISKGQALDCLQSADLIGIGMEADAVRRRLHPENVVSYAVDCVVSAGDGLDAIEDLGTSSVCLKSVPGMTFAKFEEALLGITQRFPALRVHGPSGGEILRMADAAGLSADDAIVRLQNAALTSFAGDDLGVGTSSRPVLELHRLAHRAGIRTTAGMVFGAGESLEDRVDHLFTIREIQEETGGFTAFTPWSFTPAAGSLEAPTAVEYMRTLAVARMVLDNVENVESNCFSTGAEGGADGAALRSERRRGYSGERDEELYRGRPAKGDPRCWFHAGRAGYAVQDDVSE